MIVRADNCRAFHIQNIVDVYTQECMVTIVNRHITLQYVIDQLLEFFLFRGVPECIGSDNKPEFAAKLTNGISYPESGLRVCSENQAAPERMGT